MEACCEFIHIKKNGADGTSYPLTGGSEMILGSDKDCDFRIQLPSVCDKHVKIKIGNDGKVFISSIGDSSVIKLNDKNLKRPSFVPHKSTITVGNLKFRFDYSAALSTSMQEMGKSPKISMSPRTNKENMDINVPLTPVSASKKGRKQSFDKVPTPIPQRSRKSSTGCKSSLSTSLMSIPESAEPTPSPGAAVAPRLRILAEDLDCIGKRTRKSVSFGPMLSPEYFDRRLPPNTPVKRGSLPFGVTSLQRLEDIIDEDEVETPHMSPATEKNKPEREEEPNHPGDSESTRCTLPSPLKNAIKAESQQLRHTKKSLPTPIKKAIRSNPTLRKTKRSLPTPIRMGIKAHSGLKKTKKSLPTPLRSDIQNRPSLRKTKKSLPTPVRSAIQSRPSLRKTMKSLPTPLRAGIQSKPSLRKTKKSLPTPVRKGIESKPSLRKTLKSLPTPVREGIKSKPALRKTMKSMPTPLREDIKSRPSLRKTKMSLPTPVRKAIEKKPMLRKTLKSLPTPLRAEIKSHPTLRQTKKSLPTPVKKEIISKPKLRATKRSLPTPLRNEIKAKISLRKTKLSLATPIKDQIRSRPVLRKTKRSMPTPVRNDICSRPQLRKTKKSLPTPIRKDIESVPRLRATKRSLPTPLKAALQAKHILRKTKKVLPSTLIDEIKSKPALRKTKKSLPTPLRQDINRGASLRKTKRSMPTPLRKDIESHPNLRNTKKSLPTPLRQDINRGASLRKTKQSMPTPLRKDIESHPNLRSTKKSLPTPVRAEIESCPPLRKVLKSLPSPLRKEIHSKPELRNVKITVKPTAQHKTSRKRNRSLDPTTPSASSEPALKKQRFNPATPWGVSSTLKATPVPQKKKLIENIPALSPILDATALKNLFKSNNGDDTDPVNYFEPFLFEAQASESIEVVKKQKGRPRKSRNTSSTVLTRPTPMPTRRSTRSSSKAMESVPNSTIHQPADVMIPRKTGSKRARNEDGPEPVAKRRVTRSTRANPTPMFDTGDTTTCSVEPLASKPVTQVTRNTRSSSTSTQMAVSKPVVRGKRMTRSSRNKGTNVPTDLPEPGTLKMDSDDQTEQLVKKSEKITKRQTRASKRNNCIETNTHPCPNNNEKLTQAEGVETVGTASTEQEKSLRRSSRLHKDSSGIANSTTASQEPPKPASKKMSAGKKGKQVDFSLPPQVTPITPVVPVRRSARLRSKK